MNIHAFLITFLAGISTILGFFILWWKKEEKIIPFALGFSASVMIFISLFDLLPEAFSYFQKAFLYGFHILFCLLFFLLGILGSTIIEEAVHKKIGEGNSLYQVGILSMLVIILHNLPEGIITYLTSTIQWKTGLFLGLSIACHNIPEGICIAIPIYYSTGSKKKAFGMVLLSALAEPLGAFLAASFLVQNLSTMMLGIFLSMVAGMMLSLAFLEILPEAFKNSFSKTMKAFGIGTLFLLITHLLF